MRNKMDFNITTDESLKKLPYFHKTVELLNRLEDNGILSRLSGNCISACEMIQTMLTQSGIECEIIECQVSVFKMNDSVEFYFVGYDNTAFPGQIDTHTVVLTKTEVPFIIDVSISNLLPTNHPYIIERANGSNLLEISNVKFDNVTVTYQRKKNIKIPHLHQKTIIERISEERKTKDLISKIRIFAMIAVALGLINFAFNTILLSIKMNEITITLGGEE
jgi:hypothetical protein